VAALLAIATVLPCSGNLRVLDLSSNALSGSLPSLAAGSLQQLDLSNNSLTGQLPADVAELPALRQLRLTGNELARLQGLPAFLALDR
jgi:Leucine-rich repeat (LRR) protein